MTVQPTLVCARICNIVWAHLFVPFYLHNIGNNNQHETRYLLQTKKIKKWKEGLHNTWEGMYACFIGRAFQANCTDMPLESTFCCLCATHFCVHHLSKIAFKALFPPKTPARSFIITATCTGQIPVLERDGLPPVNRLASRRHTASRGARSAGKFYIVLLTDVFLFF